MNQYPNYISLSDTSTGAAELPLTSQGDLLTRNSTENIRLPIGAVGQVLTTSDGINPSWGTIAGSGDVVGGVTSVDNEVVVYNGPGGKTIKSSGGLLYTDLVKGPATALSNSIPLYDGTTGKLLKDSTILAHKDASINLVLGGSSGSINPPTASQNVLIGDNAYAISDGTTNTGTGVNCLDKITTASENSAYGNGCLTSLLTTNSNSAFGRSALGSCISTGNSGFGALSGNSVTTGLNNTFIGRSADGAATLNNQTSLGYQALADKSNQIMLGNSTVTEIVPNASAAVSLGSATNTFTSTYLEDIAEPANSGAGTGVIFKKTGDDGLFWKPDAAGVAIDLTSTGAGGEVNTASNVGTAGVGVFKQKTGVNLEFKKINAGSSKVTITDDTGNNEVDVDVVEANIGILNLSGAPSSSVVGVDDVQTLTQKTVTDLKITDTSGNNTYQILTPELTADRVINMPLLTAADTFTTDNHPSTMTNKTFITPEIWDLSGFDFKYTLTTPNLAADRVLNLPLLTADDTMVTEDHIQTLTNKTIAAGSNTITGLANTDVGLGNVVNTKVSLNNAVSPAVSNDNTEGYTIGSTWIDTTADKAYVALDVSTGAAVWTETTQSGGGGSSSSIAISGVGTQGVLSKTTPTAITLPAITSAHADWSLSGGTLTYTGSARDILFNVNMAFKSTTTGNADAVFDVIQNTTTRSLSKMWQPASIGGGSTFTFTLSLAMNLATNDTIKIEGEFAGSTVDATADTGAKSTYSIIYL